MKRIRAILVGTVALAAMLPVQAMAKTRALLLGVADYTVSTTIPDLNGPRNDVTLVWQALLKRQVAMEDITVLTDGLPQSAAYPAVKAAPTAANILAELDALADATKKGDVVMVYYSGHGGRQPDNPAIPESEPEPDGWDQIIFPSDSGVYDNFELTTKNAIVDDTIEQKLNAIRAKGAFVWAVFDSCHSGTVTRGSDVARNVTPEMIGIDPNMVVAPPNSRSASREPSFALKSDAGDLVGFFAVDSSQQAVERDFAGYDPVMVGKDKPRFMGVFTNHMLRALARNSATTFRELAQEIISGMSQDRSVDQTKLPLFDGALDHPLPGSDGKRRPQTFSGMLLADGQLSIPAGSLQGLDAGAQVTLYEPTAPDKPLATGTIGAATAVTSQVDELAWEDGVEPLPPGRVSVVMTAPAISFAYTLAPPPDSDFADDGERQMVQGLLATAFTDSSKTLGIDLAAAGTDDADMILRLKDNRLWLTSRDKQWITTPKAFDETPSLDLGTNPETLAQTLRNAVWTMARASKLVRLTAALGSGSEADDDGITIAAQVIKGERSDPKAPCTGKAPANAQSSPIEPLMPVAANNCDIFEMTVTNESDNDYYVAGFYVEALGGVVPIPRNTAKTGCVRTLPSDGAKPLTFRFWTDIWDEKAQRPSATGAENFVILAVPKDDSHQPPALCDLTQNSVDAFMTRTAKGNGTNAALSQLLQDVSGSATRSAGTETASLTMSGRVFMLNVEP